MNTITIPKKLAGKDDLVVIPRKDYEALLDLKKSQEFKPTPAQKKSLARAEANLQKNKSLSYNELAKKLGFTN